ncbi:MAG TPA: fimbria/pilus periplasmic chaperone [Buttiauxella sp.]|jgi:fimbrial chaperone protein
MRVKFCRKVFGVITVFLLMLSTYATASVTMLNTRVIYPSDAQSQTVQFTNDDTIPYVMQVWSDINNPTSTPDNADGPFITVPALFRIEPKTGQSVRLVFTGKKLPHDRESVFYLDTIQIPPKNTAGNAQNQMMIVLRNRMKIFYRPKEITGSPDDVAKKIRFSLSEEKGRWVLTATNDSGYYASLISASVVKGNKNIPFNVDMVPPKSQLHWTLNKNESSLSGAQKVKFTLVNDYGGHTDAEAVLNK